MDSLSPYFNYAGTDPLILLIQLFRAKFMDRVVRCKVIVRVADESGDAPILIWDRECAELVGVSTGDLKAKYPEAEDLSQGSGLEKLNGLDDFEEDLGDGSATLPLNRCLLKEFVYFC
nr:replication protein A 70 kDa DNA-binding subunit B-like [Ipomoea batatas]GMC53456.1 replication protein A 70 kDa DNA-binding subunit B-like [Ipomoea batatas]GMD53986.1 replication protein A 70 kDa DNA-binding subunit B-like [Ipomoea batatas]GME14678.1 replication protein A 70 kDa DNA-binding subunit B-like [Ipomoea batatas]